MLRNLLVACCLIWPLLARGAPARSLAEANRTFAVELYGKLATGEGNVFFSPTSIQLALAMTAEGARGDTATQMREVLHLQAGDGPRLAAGLDGGKDYELRLANRLWAQAGYPFQKPFLELTAREYGAGLVPVDFRRSFEPSRAAINEWVKSRTSGKITDLVPLGALTELTRLVLVNAIYFKGKWARAFDKQATSVSPFHLLSGKSVPAPLMRQHGSFGYAAIDGAKLVSLPYLGSGGDALDMVLIVPDANDGLRELEKRLVAPGALAGWLGRLEPHELDVYLPRWKATFSAGLNKALPELGMPLAFDPARADLSGIASVGDTHELPLYIAAVLHKAFIEVNEAGTEAAAASAVIVATIDSVPRPIAVRADRPFVYLIRHKPTGKILFLGRTVDPTLQ